MAAETVEPSAHKNVQGTSIPSRKSESGSHDAHEREKQTVTSARPSQQLKRQSNPFVITDRPEEKHLGISAKNLGVTDFVLLRTLGTGKPWFGLAWYKAFYGV